MSEIEKAIKNIQNHLKNYKDNLKQISLVNSINKDWDGIKAMGQPITLADRVYVGTVESIAACDLAIQALQEKADKEKGCEFCNNHKPLLSLCTEYAIEIDDKEISVWQDLKCLETFNINYCPMCGRKLVEE